MPPPCPLSRVILLYCFESSTRDPNATSICARQLSSAEIIIFPNSAFFFINDERDAPLKYHVSSPFQLGNSRENASLYPAVLKYICAYARRHCTQAISHVLWMFFYVFFYLCHLEGSLSLLSEASVFSSRSVFSGASVRVRG